MSVLKSGQQGNDEKNNQSGHEDGIDIDAAFDFLLFAVPEYQDQDCYEEKKLEHTSLLDLNRFVVWTMFKSSCGKKQSNMPSP